MHFFVTGATGFLGSYLAADLLAAGHEVTVLVRPGADTWRLSEVLSRLHVLPGTLADLDSLAPQITAAGFDGVAHLAWRGVGNTDRNSPVQARNVPDTVELAALAAEGGARVFVGAGSQAEYGPHPRIIREDDAARPTTLYGKAKLAAGSMAGQLAAERGIRFAWLRIFSTYGPKDADAWLIPSMIRTLKSGQRMALTGCEQLWSFLHARDAAAGFRLALTDPGANGVYNLGAPEAPPLRETVTTLRDLVDPGAELGFGEVPYRPDQVMVLQPDMSRLMGHGWRPQVALADGLRETVASYVRT